VVVALVPVALSCGVGELSLAAAGVDVAVDVATAGVLVVTLSLAGADMMTVRVDVRLSC
jgi:hypothetical protein